MASTIVYEVSESGVSERDLGDFSEPSPVSGLLPGSVLPLGVSSEFVFGKNCSMPRLHLDKGKFPVSALSLYEGSKVYDGCPPLHRFYDMPGMAVHGVARRLGKKWPLKGFDFYGSKFSIREGGVLFDTLFWLGMEKGKLDRVFSLLTRFRIFRFYDRDADRPDENHARSFAMLYSSWRGGASVWNERSEGIREKVEKALVGDAAAPAGYVRRSHGRMKVLF